MKTYAGAALAPELVSPAAPVLATVTVSMGFHEAVAAVLDFLRARLPHHQWSVARPDIPHPGPSVGVPVQDADGTVFAVLRGVPGRIAPAGRDGGRMPFPGEAAPPGEAALLELLARLLGMVLSADRLREDLVRAGRAARMEADTDVLTGLLSRRAWEARLHSPATRPAVLVLVDLDGLKEVNDTRGHGAGDELLRAAAAALRDAVRSGDPVARIGGDEFGVLLGDTGEGQAPRRVEALSAALERAGVAASLGWAPCPPGAGWASAVARADERMYAAKAARRLRIPRPAPRG